MDRCGDCGGIFPIGDLSSCACPRCREEKPDPAPLVCQECVLFFCRDMAFDPEIKGWRPMPLGH